MWKLKKVSSSGPLKLPGGELVIIIAEGEGVEKFLEPKRILLESELQNLKWVWNCEYACVCAYMWVCVVWGQVWASLKFHLRTCWENALSLTQISQTSCLGCSVCHPVAWEKYINTTASCSQSTSLWTHCQQNFFLHLVSKPDSQQNRCFLLKGAGQDFRVKGRWSPPWCALTKASSHQEAPLYRVCNDYFRLTSPAFLPPPALSLPHSCECA